MEALPTPEFFDELLQIADNLAQFSPSDEQDESDKTGLT